MKPEKIDVVDYDNYVYAICQCPLPINHAIKMPKIKGVYEYKFKYDNCGCEGIVGTYKEEKS